jgi:cytochrome c5
MKRKTLMLLPMVASVLSTALALAQASVTAKPVSTQAAATVKANSSKQSDDGGRKFDANCGRCHSAPEQLSPSITGTVLRHMRVRANLSAQDEKDILRYLAP